MTCINCSRLGDSNRSRTPGTRYEQLRASVREQAVMHTDDTGWRVGGRTAFLMAFVKPSLAVYQIRNRHRNEEVRELVAGDFAGVLVCDRGKNYEAEELADAVQLETEGLVEGGDCAPCRKSRTGCG
jgi:hypothetical protein